MLTVYSIVPVKQVFPSRSGEFWKEIWRELVGGYTLNINYNFERMTKRVVAYIDGFNVYHAIANNLPDKYKWLDYRKFVQNFLDADDSLINIIFFTATPSWDPVRVLRHNAYMSVLVSHL